MDSRLLPKYYLYFLNVLKFSNEQFGLSFYDHITILSLLIIVLYIAVCSCENRVQVQDNQECKTA